jgi:hypothetical protein
MFLKIKENKKMARYDIKSEIKQEVALDFQTISTDTTTVGNEIDMKGWNSAAFMIACSARTTGDATLLIQHSDVSGSGYVDVPDTFLSGLESDTTVDAAQELKIIGYVGKKEHVKPSVVSANGATLDVGVIVIKSKGDVPVV